LRTSKHLRRELTTSWSSEHDRKGLTARARATPSAAVRPVPCSVVIFNAVQLGALGALLCVVGGLVLLSLQSLPAILRSRSDAPARSLRRWRPRPSSHGAGTILARLNGLSSDPRPMRSRLALAGQVAGRCVSAEVLSFCPRRDRDRPGLEWHLRPAEVEIKAERSGRQAMLVVTLPDGGAVPIRTNHPEWLEPAAQAIRSSSEP
jgi:hypothetical protein